MSGDGGRSGGSEKELDSGSLVTVQPSELAHGYSLRMWKKELQNGHQGFGPEQPEVWNSYLLREQRLEKGQVGWKVY